MNLQDITAKAWILALFIRDDGERFLLGDGWYDFKDSLQHFQPDNIANDVVELQGADGQLLAGQVRRSGTQEFSGYVGDATTPKAIIETRRRDFLGFFRARSRYKVVYIFPDGTAIQRQRGYLVEPATVQEMWQFFPEYHVALSFENVPYYEYVEDSEGDEIYAHTMTIRTIGQAAHSGMAFNYSDCSVAYPTLQRYQPSGISIQRETPTPDNPIPIKTGTGLQIIAATGTKNLLRPRSGFAKTQNDVSIFWRGTGEILINGTATADTYLKTTAEMQNYEVTIPANSYTFSVTNVPDGVEFKLYSITGTGTEDLVTNTSQHFTITAPARVGLQIAIPSGTVTNVTCEVQLEAGTTATEFARYKGVERGLNLGKNLQGGFSAAVNLTHNGITFVNNANGTISYSAGTVSGGNALSMFGSTATSNNRVFWLGMGNYILSGGTEQVQLEVVKPNGATVAKTWPSSGVVAFTLDTTSKVFVRANVPDGTTLTAGTVSPQLEAGSFKTAYFGYIPPIELNLVSTTQDSIYYSNGWYLRKETGKVILDGTEAGWNYNSNLKAFWILCSDAGMASFTSSTKGHWPKLCDYFAYHAQAPGSTSPDGIYEDGAAYTSKLFIKHNASTSLDAFKSWLGAHPITIYFKRTSASVTQVTNTTIVSQLNSLNSGFSIPAPRGTFMAISEPNNAPVDNYARFMSHVGEQTITNSAPLPTYPIWRIVGPATAPLTLKNGMTGESITYNADVGTGSELIIDMANQTATIGTANVIANISGSWLSISDGDVIAYTNGGGNTTSTLVWNGVVG